MQVEQQRFVMHPFHPVHVAAAPEAPGDYQSKPQDIASALKQRSR